MFSLAEFIAQNPYLQAASVLIAIVGALAFIIKHAFPAFKFAMRAVKDGFRVAVISLMKSSVRNAKIDSYDSILVITTLSRLWFTILQRLFYLVMMYLLIISINTSFEFKRGFSYYSSFQKHPMLITFFIILGFFLSIASTWAIFKPIAALWIYKRSLRRFVLRRIFRKMMP